MSDTHVRQHGRRFTHLRPQHPCLPPIAEAAPQRSHNQQLTRGGAIGTLGRFRPAFPKTRVHGFIVSFDWHLTLADGADRLCPWAVEAVTLMAQMVGHQNIRLLSYSGWATEQRTRARVANSALRHILTHERLLFTRAKTGARGKAKMALDLAGHRTWVHVDDRQEIVRDFRDHGLKAVGVNKFETATAFDAAKFIAEHILQ